MVSLKKDQLEKSHVGIQFMKYSLCGSFALGVDMVVSFLVAWRWFPALKESEFLVRLFGIQVEPLSKLEYGINFAIGGVLAFMVSNLVAYVLNVRFVFKAGKHSRWKEIGLFYLVSGISVGIGIVIGAVFISWFGLSYGFSFVAKAVSTTLINFVARKLIIFHG